MKNTKTLTRVALLVAIELVMKMVGAWLIPKTAENPTDRRYKPLGKP